MRSLLLVLFLFGCAGGSSGPCQLQQIADLPATLDHNLLQVTGHVNRADTRLLIDTGAERTVLTTATVASLMLPRSKFSLTRLIGVGGAVSNADVFAELELGGAHFSERLAVADIPTIGGLVGGDVLSNYDVEFDLPQGRVRLWHATGGCSASDLPWSGQRSTVPVQITAGDRVLVPVTIDGSPITAILDSGAALSLLQTDVARRLGVSQAALAADPELVVRGVDGGAISVRIHRFTSLSVGEDRISAPRIGVGTTQFDAPDMLLGLNYLRTRRVWISYRSGQMFMQ
jgi:predicted aspartyl protease